MEEKVILVNEDDRETGQVEKMEAHVKGLLHRAFSVFIFNKNGELIMQKRAPGKYHSAGLWTNTCCSHPRPGEDLQSAATRRLMEEMGLTCNLEPLFTFIYKAHLNGGLIEHELDHVFFGVTNSLPLINKEEATDWKYTSMQQLANDLKTDPASYTAWLHICFDKLLLHINANEKK